LYKDFINNYLHLIEVMNGYTNKWMIFVQLHLHIQIYVYNITTQSRWVWPNGQWTFYLLSDISVHRKYSGFAYNSISCCLSKLTLLLGSKCSIFKNILKADKSSLTHNWNFSFLSKKRQWWNKLTRTPHAEPTIVCFLPSQ